MDFVTGSRFFAVLAITAGLVAVAGTVLRRTPAIAPLRDVALPLASLVAIVATGGSLWYSEGVGLEPCTLCWVQRAAMYPLAVLLPLLAVSRLRPLLWGVQGLAVVGLATSLWHIALQRIPVLSSTVSCSSATPCNAALVDMFGFVTIPTMAAAGFAAILVLTTLVPRESLS